MTYQELAALDILFTRFVVGRQATLPWRRMRTIIRQARARAARREEA